MPLLLASTAGSMPIGKPQLEQNRPDRDVISSHAGKVVARQAR
jgi:hypothetical protein